MSARDQTIESPAAEPDCPKSQRRPMTIRLQSAGYADGNFCKVDINKSGLTNSGDRGLNVVLINHRDGLILEATNFDTHISNEESEDFSRMIEAAVDGTYVLIVAKDDCFEQLTEAAKLACESVGSKGIRDVGYRDSWCIIGRKGAPPGSVPESHQFTKSGPSEIIEMTINFEDEETPDLGIAAKNPTTKFTTPNNGRWLRRRMIDGALQRYVRATIGLHLTRL